MTLHLTTMRRGGHLVLWWLVCLVLSSALISCAPPPPPTDIGSSDVRPVASSRRAPPGPAPLETTNELAASTAPPRPGRIAALEVEGWERAVLWLPPLSAGAKKKPLLVAGHGAWGTPEAHCDRWIELVGAQAFILCTRGRPTNKLLPPEQRGYFYDGHHELGREVMAAVDAVRTRFPDELDADRAVYAGYSQSATMGAHFLHASKAHVSQFPRVIMIEGGSAEWNVPLSEQFRAAGGQRVLFICGQKRCGQEAERSSSYLRKADVEVRAFYAAGAGHTYLGEVGEIVAREISWLVDGDPRWAQ